MIIGLLLSIPLLSYFVTLFYAVCMATFHGHVWVKDAGVMINEYLITTAVLYALCLLGHTLRKYKK